MDRNWRRALVVYITVVSPSMEKKLCGTSQLFEVVRHNHTGASGGNLWSSEELSNALGRPRVCVKPNVSLRRASYCVAY